MDSHSHADCSGLEHAHATVGIEHIAIVADDVTCANRDAGVRSGDAARHCAG